MKTTNITTALLLAVIFLTPSFSRSEDDPEKQQIRTEERMKEEKKRDEQTARDCGNRVKVARFDTVWRTPRTDDIEVYQMAQLPNKPFRPVAFLTFDVAARDESQAVAGFIAKAKDLGADGVLMIGFTDEVQIRTVFSPDDRRLYRANAIMFSKKP